MKITLFLKSFIFVMQLFVLSSNANENSITPLVDTLEKRPYIVTFIVKFPISSTRSACKKFIYSCVNGKYFSVEGVSINKQQFPLQVGSIEISNLDFDSSVPEKFCSQKNTRNALELPLYESELHKKFHTFYPDETFKSGNEITLWTRIYEYKSKKHSVNIDQRKVIVDSKTIDHEADQITEKLTVNCKNKSIKFYDEIVYKKGKVYQSKNSGGASQNTVPMSVGRNIVDITCEIYED